MTRARTHRHHMVLSTRAWLPFTSLMLFGVACSDGEEVIPYELTTTSRLSVAEGESIEVEFELEPWPSDDVTIELNVDSDSEVIAQAGQIVFSGGARRRKTVTLRGVSDGKREGLQDWTLTARSPEQTWTFTGVTRDSNTTNLEARQEGVCEEGGATCTVAVSLSAEPIDRVELVVALPTEGFELASAEVLVFEPGETQKQFTLRATQDDFVTHPDEHVLTLSLRDLEPSNLWGDAPAVELALSRTNDDVATLIIPETDRIGEDARLQIPVRLGARPRGDVVVPVVIEGMSTTTANTTELTFTSSNWSATQYVEVTTFDDALALTREDTLVVGPAVSDDEAFAGLAGQTRVVIEDGVCGNGVVDGVEACDVGDDVSLDCDYGEVSCQRCSQACEWVEGTVTGFCGDGITQDTQGEQCDEGDQPSLDCAYGESSCTRCDASCAEVSGVVTGYCGDGVVQDTQGEQCDVDTFTNTCQDLGFDYGEMACDANTCGEDASGCFSWVDIHALWGCSCLERHDGHMECWGQLRDQNHDVCDFVHERSGNIFMGMGKACELDAQGYIVGCNTRFMNPDPIRYRFRRHPGG